MPTPDDNDTPLGRARRALAGLSVGEQFREETR